MSKKMTLSAVILGLGLATLFLAAQIYFITVIYSPTVSSVAAVADPKLGEYVEGALGQVFRWMLIWPIACLCMLVGIALGVARRPQYGAGGEV